MLAALRQKYGSPQKEELRVLANGFGREMNSRRFIWSSEKYQLIADEHSGSVNDAKVSFIEPDIIEKAKAVKNDVGKAASKDL